MKRNICVAVSALFALSIQSAAYAAGDCLVVKYNMDNGFRNVVEVSEPYIYKGNCRNGLAHGEGSLTEGGTKSNGTFENGFLAQKIVNGVPVAPTTMRAEEPRTQNKLEGEKKSSVGDCVVNGAKIVNGSRVVEEEDAPYVYKGACRNGFAHGKGILRGRTGNTVTGTFENGFASRIQAKGIPFESEIGDGEMVFKNGIAQSLSLYIAKKEWNVLIKFSDDGATPKEVIVKTQDGNVATIKFAEDGKTIVEKTTIDAEGGNWKEVDGKMVPADRKTQVRADKKNSDSLKLWGQVNGNIACSNAKETIDFMKNGGSVTRKEYSDAKYVLENFKCK